MATTRAGIDKAVVYEDALPWNPDKGVCYEIEEHRQWRIEDCCWHYDWVVRDSKCLYTCNHRFIRDDTPEAVIDSIRREAKLRILEKMHACGVI